MVQVYLAQHCYICRRSLALIERLRMLRPTLKLAIMYTDDPQALIPRYVIGTPMYAWNDRVLFMGNPSETELLEQLDALTRQP